jgi:uncharacterized protein (DUF433 family)
MMLICGGAVFAYSVLTHEEIIDLLWKGNIQPLLLKRYPGLSEDQLREAHAYAYGGAVVQDMGYYPFGSVQFSDLVHYVRSGDFVRELIAQSQDANEYAFALGALGHYASDVDGHPAVNQSVAIGYPKLRFEYGSSVRYAEGKTEHIKTEFGFDMVQVSKNRYASQQYHDFIGFKVAKSLLERTFPIVYGVELKDVLTHEDLAVGSYRLGVSRMIPQMTQVALRLHEKDMVKEYPDFDKKKFLFRLSMSEYEKEWGKDYTKPDFGTRAWSEIFRFMPKIGPFKSLNFKVPTPATEDLYFKSINASVDQYRIYLEEVGTDRLVLPNRDFDTGNETKAGEYSLADSTYGKLLAKLADGKFDRTSADLQDNILKFYSGFSVPNETKKDKDHLEEGQWQLEQLKATACPAPATHPAK